MAENTGPEDQDLERLLRAGLGRHADDVDTAVPVAARARSAARRRRGTRVAAGVGALAVAAAAVTAVVIDLPDNDEGRGTQVIDSPSADPLPSQWRTEYWHDVQVDVPEDWGWGTAPLAPFDGSGGDPMVCGYLAASVDADGNKVQEPDPELGYVGRPILQSDMCMGGGSLEAPTAPYVWLGPAVQPGTVDLGNGYVQETVEVNGSTLTVATQDPALRERILGSATGGETCQANLDQPPTVESMLIEGMGLVRSGLLCVYRDESDKGLDLVYSRELTGEEGQAFMDAAYAAPKANGCDYEQPFEYAVVTLTGDDPFGAEPVSQDYVVDTGCSRIETSPGEFHELTEANVKPWAGAGVGATMTGPSLMGADWPYRYFIGMQG